ncbi:MAG TPA: hypothetical protein VGX03_32835 [Candidatus Binatia bacterium]|jgi:hypothetical protein|nr:hypothetical protein [Candidatus Binatia bacterium]
MKFLISRKGLPRAERPCAGAFLLNCDHGEEWFVDLATLADLLQFVRTYHGGSGVKITATQPGGFAIELPEIFGL